VGGDRTLDQGDPRSGFVGRLNAQASRVVSPHCKANKKRAWLRAFFSLLTSSLRNRFAVSLEERPLGRVLNDEQAINHHPSRRANSALLTGCGRCLSGELSDHQDIENDYRRQAQDHRPDAERPKNVLGGKTLFSRECIVLDTHDAPALSALAGILIPAEF
jgi:hypothetical protein